MRESEGDHQLDIALLTTGGTIDKTYDPLQGVLRNHVSVLDLMLEGMELEGVNLHRFEVLNKDSLDMDAEDHRQIAMVATEEAGRHDGVVIVHGTDRLACTGDAIVEAAGDGLGVPIVLTGAMRPWIMRNSDAPQNLTESLLAVQLLDPGVYVCMHNRVLRFPGVQKDQERLRFVYSSPSHSE
jgi:L-asparaginase